MGGLDSLCKKGGFLRGLSLFLLLTWSRSSAGRSKASLFEFSEHVLELNPDSFGLKAGSTEPWVINCYSPGCPHCTHFAPTWEKIGGVLRDSAVKVGAINCVKHRDLCRAIGVQSYPSLIALNYPGASRGTASDPATKVVKTGGGTLEGTLGQIKGAFCDLFDETALNAVNSVSPARELEEKDVGATESQQRVVDCILRLEDAIASVVFTLKNDVFTEGLELSEERKEKVLSFLDLLATTFPGNDNRLEFRSLATELRRDLHLNDFGRWDHRIDDLKISSFPKEANWPAANIETGTERGANHFTNGLWSLFHALSVSSAPSRQKPYDIMEGIQSFVGNFFRCEHCRKHFLEMYQTCENDRCKILKRGSIGSQHNEEGEAALALWMWRTHNAVNAHVASYMEKDVNSSLWPKADACKRCWKGFPQGVDKPPWSETAVLDFLRKSYSCPDLLSEDAGFRGHDSTATSWAITSVVVCAGVLFVMWARRWQEMRGVGLTKKLVDSSPSV